jgi:hypothetical protein
MLGAALLSGCALLPEPPGVVDSAVADALVAARAPAGEQRTALARAQQQFMRDQSALNRLRLATLLAALPPPLRDDARALELLEPLADAGAPGSGRFAVLLSAQIVERQRLARELDRSAKERERIEREHKRSDEERDKREETMRQQLEALRSIERGILEREERLRRKPR